MAPVPVILDVDTGVDDALALLLAVCCPEIDLLAVTCVHGNVPVNTVVVNTLRVLDAAGAPEDLPVACGFGEPLIQPAQHCHEIHGEDGLGDLQPPLPASGRKPYPGHAVKLLNDTLRESPEPLTVIALGPLTNIAMAFRTDPEVWRSNLKCLLWMGGAVSVGGNATQWGEANAAYDPEAVHIILNSGLPLWIYPWDVFLKVSYTKAELEALTTAAARGSRPAADLARRLLWRELTYFKQDITMIGDAGAIAALIRTEALTVQQLHVEVELHGPHTRGMTVCDLRKGACHSDEDEEVQGATAHVIVDVDAAALKLCFTEHVLAGVSQASPGGSGSKRAAAEADGPDGLWKRLRVSQPSAADAGLGHVLPRASGCAGRLPVILDVDTGIDDALALLLAVRAPEYNLLAVTCVNGNVDVDTVVSNTLKVLDVAGAPADLPVARGFAEPLIEPVHHCLAVHGSDGMGGFGEQLPASARKLSPLHAVELLNEMLRAAPEPLTVIATAPLTNVAAAFRTAPQLWREKLARLVWMGGAVAIGGNSTSWGEANAHCDPEAAHVIFNSGLPVTMYPWDVFIMPTFAEEELPAFSAVELGRADAVSALAAGMLRCQMSSFGSQEATIGDAGAVAAAVLGASTTVRRLHIEAELHGHHTRGMTVCDLRSFAHPPDKPQQPPNVDVVVDLDVSAFKSFFKRVLLDSE